MTSCAHCSGTIRDESRFCPSCGAPVAPSTSSPTQTSVEEQGPTRALTSRSGASSSGDPSRFTPGDVLAGRYRIATLLGRGGMGEVYRADDLKLGQPVALKFLPPELEQDPHRLERFLNEVRTARQVAHPNVCRMYDVGETTSADSGQPQHFLSMEYVDGEDLASLLRRIGRLPEDKAIQLARQLCAGLAAAHQQGILHRDLKPANIMIDGRGRARITDFGLAGLAESFEGAEIRAGTPGYMAPEQLEGREVTEKSDVYSLGLVLYELFTGEPAFPSTSAQKLRDARKQSTPLTPSSVLPGLDPTVERIVMRCLDPDPVQRPSSALAVSAALPGGDPLAEALAAGETPSPEMVAAAGGVGGLRPAVAFSLLGVVLVGILGIVLTHGAQMLNVNLDLSESPAALVFKTRQIIEDGGYTEPARDRAHGFSYDQDKRRFVRETEGETGDWSALTDERPPAAFFWYRQSPRYLSPRDFTNITVTETDPHPGVAGMVGVRLDPQGRLLRFHAVPNPEAEAAAGEVDWSSFFRHAALDALPRRAIEPKWVPPDYCDQPSAWNATFADQPDLPVRVEACAHRGRPVYFELVLPWSQAPQTAADPGLPIIDVIGLIFLAILLAGAVVLARINVRLGRGDGRGAARLAAVIFTTNTGIALFQAHHIPSFDEAGFFFQTLAWGLMMSAMVWLVYLALEPFARRIWPDILISWNRMLAGRLRDPRIGRDLLIGGVAGVVAALLGRLSYFAPAWFGLLQPEPAGGRLAGFDNGALVALESIPHFIAVLFQIPQLVINNIMAGVFLLVLVSVVVRKPRIAIAVTFGIFSALGSLGATNAVIDVPIAILTTAIFMVVLVRFGLLALAAMTLVTMTDQFSVLTLDFTSWHAGRTWFLVLLLCATFVYACKLSLSGRSVATVPR